MRRWARTWIFGATLALAACSSTPPQTAADAKGLRKSADGSSDVTELGEWLLAESLAPEGSAKEAGRARAQLDTAFRETKTDTPQLVARVAAGLYDEIHGRPDKAAEQFVRALVAARRSDEPNVALYSWFAALHLASLRGSVDKLYARHQQELDTVTLSPGAIGWRAVAVLLEWQVAERGRRASVQDKAFDQQVASDLGCANSVRLAGPFGSGVARDQRQSWPAEAPGAWPAVFAADPSRGTLPKVLKTEQVRCLSIAREHSADGVFYAETYFDTNAERELIISVQGAHAVWIDDLPVLRRDLREFGVWQRFGARVTLPAGRHRVLARIANEQTTVRLLNPDGTSARIRTDDDATRPYGLRPPQLGADPNVLDPIVRSGPTGSPAVDAIAAYLAHADGLDDVASWLVEPHVKTGSAGAIMLELAALYARGDAAYGQDGRRANEKALHERAVRRDPDLWYSLAWLALDEGAQKSPLEALEPLKKLAARFPQQPELQAQLVALYQRLGYGAERLRTAKLLAERFPDDLTTQRLYLEALDELGSGVEADAVAKRVQALDPDAEVELARAMAKLDFESALAELERLRARRPDRKDIAGRIADVLRASGDPRAALEELSRSLAKNPDDADLRLQLADRAYAGGDTAALRRALADSLKDGVKAQKLRAALELVEGRTALEPYRQDGAAVIAQFAAWEKKGNAMEGSAARVLDYSALWIHPDGSSEMLEHEILKIQSQEAIGRESEQEPPSGLILRLRVIKPDGTTYEPVPVQGKPTLTMPHLEVGDYVEIEHISSSSGEARGRRYRGPTWFFREADKGYWRSEFVTLAPKSRPLAVETRGQVPAPTVVDHGSVIERRWLVRESPPAPEEPNAPPAQEFLPSVRIGWGVSLADTVAQLTNMASDESVKDPRFLARAQNMVRDIPESKIDERAQKIYREVLSTIDDGRETDGRRVLTSRSGSRQAAFTFLLRQLGIDYDYAVVQSRLAAPPVSSLSEVDAWDALALRVKTGKSERWLTVRDKFAPYGYLPAELRGQPAIVLAQGNPKVTTPKEGSLDALRVEGRAELRKNGSAKVELVEHFQGKLAISMRSVLARLPEAQLADFVETRLIGSNIAGLRVRGVKVEQKDDLDAPVVLRIQGEVSELAKVQGKKLVLKPIFPIRLTDFASLGERQTPLFLATSSRLEVDFQVVAEEGVRLPGALPNAKESFGDAYVEVKDQQAGRTLTLRRTANVPTARIAPGEPYQGFVQFARGADAIFERELELGL